MTRRALSRAPTWRGHARSPRTIRSTFIGPIADDRWGVAARPLIYHALGRTEDSDAALAELIERFSDINTVAVAEAYAYRGEIDRAFEWLDRALEQRTFRIAYVKTNPLLANLVDDPRFSTLLVTLDLSTDGSTRAHPSWAVSWQGRQGSRSSGHHVGFTLRREARNRSTRRLQRGSDVRRPISGR